MLIGFIGQGWIGKNYADNFESRGYEVIRYALEAPYNENKEKINEADIVFVAVPTPTKDGKCDDSIVRDALSLARDGATVVIKSTLLPGTTVTIQKDFPKIIVLHSPEFLTERTASHDANHPNRNIVGISEDTTEQNRAAKQVLDILPEAPFASIMDATSAEIVKYGRNTSGFTRVVFINPFYDWAQKLGGDWKKIQEAMAADPDTGPTYINPIHKSGHAADKPAGRGAGGHCYIKDFAAFVTMYEKTMGKDDPEGLALLRALERKNIQLLRDSGKDLDLLEDTYGPLD